MEHRPIVPELFMLLSSIPILTYHSLDESHSVISTSPSMFKKQMDYLWKNGYQTFSLTKVKNFIRQRKPFPQKTVVITFDDGYKNTYTEAFPILKQYGFMGTIFLITDYCGNLIEWPEHSSSIKQYPILSWSEIKEMVEYGFEFGAHTLTHPDLTRISIKEAEREIIQSKIKIQECTGEEVQVFAYPYGRYNTMIREIVQQHFLVACSTRLGKVKIDSDPYLLKRIDMYYLSNYRVFNAVASGTLDWYLQMRQVLRDFKRIFT